jgi:hypothetical protein
MPAAEGKLAEVRSIYRNGDRIVVELPPDFYVLLVRSGEIIGGELWLHAKVGSAIIPFPATKVIRRLAPGEIFTWSMVK